MPQDYQFDEMFLQSLQFQQKLNLERDELKQRMAMDQRQLSLLDAYRNKALEQDESQFGRSIELQREKFGEDTRQFDVSNKFRYDALNQDQQQFGMKLKLDESQFQRELGLGYDKLGEEQRQFNSLLPVKQLEAEADYIKKTQGNKGDPATQRKIAEIVGAINSDMSRDETIGATEELIELTGLKNDANAIFEDLKSGQSFWESISALNKARKEVGKSEYTKDEINYLRLYFKHRE